MDYFEKLDKNIYSDLKWNLPEQRAGIIGVIGGSSGNFRTSARLSEFLNKSFNLKEVRTVLPDALKSKLPSVPGLVFVGSTETGSFADENGLKSALNATDFNLVIGDLTKNTITARVVASAVQSSEKPLLITRDAVDLAAENMSEELLLNSNLFFLASLTQIAKILHAVYYPRVILLSQPLTQIAETLHKFTLSYNSCMITFVGGQILVAKNGLVRAVPIENTSYSPITLWGGESAAKIAVMNLFNPGKPIEASIAALFD